jgi:glycosyltransferase involved in cell wall biosynthesis
VLHPDSVYKTLLRSHILIHPTRFEGMPLAVLEAMSCGCVPVVSSLPGITDLAVADGVSGILAESAKPSSFVDAVTGLASSPEKWSAMSHEAAVRTRGHFSVEHNAAQYDDLIRQTVSGPRGRGSMRECKPVPLTWRNHLRLLTDCAYGRFRS